MATAGRKKNLRGLKSGKKKGPRKGRTKVREYGEKITQMQGGEGGRAHYYHATKGWRTRCADVSRAAADMIYRLLDRL